MTDRHEIQISRLLRLLTPIPIVIYLVISVFLTILAIISLAVTFIDIIVMITTQNLAEGIIHVIHSILLTVIIIELFETVIVYLRTRRVPVRAILIAGLTAMIRHVIIFNFSNIQPIEIIGSAIMMAVLIAGVYLMREPETTGSRF